MRDGARRRAALSGPPTLWASLWAAMCGILAALGVVGDPDATRATVVRQARLLRHRGPDASSVWQSAGAGGGPHNFIAFERLQIIDTSDAGR